MFAQYSPFFNSGLLFARPTRRTQSFGVDTGKKLRGQAILPIDDEKSFFHFSSSSSIGRRVRSHRSRSKQNSDALELDLLSEFPDVPSSLPSTPFYSDLSFALSDPLLSPALQSSGVPSPELENAHFIYPTPPTRYSYHRNGRHRRTQTGCTATTQHAILPQTSSLRRSLSATSTFTLGRGRRSRGCVERGLSNGRTDAKRFSLGGMEVDFVYHHSHPGAVPLYL